MDNLKTFEEFLASSSTKVPIMDFMINFVIAVALSLILNWIYIHYGRSISNRKMFGKNFVLMTLITMLVISIVKSSLALSLGLVGALSIVRFRAAIKEPEELMYLFFAISIGLGMGANQRLITIVAFIMISLIIVFQGKLNWRKKSQNLHLTINSSGNKKVDIENIIGKLEEHCESVKLQRYDFSDKTMDASFLVEFKDYNQFLSAKNNLISMKETVNFSFLDNQDIF
ncbi:MAG: DUF4956 domain-containing protein [Saprospiraceae bacterium]|nr:DUF4956 domain-containing protein [Saprospiraceae bacterium]